MGAPVETLLANQPRLLCRVSSKAGLRVSAKGRNLASRIRASQAQRAAIEGFGYRQQKRAVVRESLSRASRNDGRLPYHAASAKHRQVVRAFRSSKHLKLD